MTPTPVAVDGIAEDAEGNKLAYLNGEWTMLPPLEGEFARMLHQPDGKVMAVDAGGKVVFELDMAEGKWKEVVREPEFIYLAETPEMAADMKKWIDVPEVVQIMGPDGKPLPDGEIKSVTSNALFCGHVIGVGKYSEFNFKTFLVRMDLPDNRILVISFDAFTGKGGSNPIKFLQDVFDPEVVPGNWKTSTNNTSAAHAAFLEKYAVGRQIMFSYNPSPDTIRKVRALQALIKGDSVNTSVIKKFGMDDFLSVFMMDEGQRP
jgi:hypothetical protein